MKAFKVISLIAVLLALGWLAYRYRSGFQLSLQSPPQGAAPPPAVEGLGEGDVGPVVKLEPFLVADTEGNADHTTTITFELEVNDEKGRHAVKSRTSQIRAAILRVLADARPSELGDPEDFSNLKQKVQGQIQALLPNDPVRRVLITEYLTQ